MKTLKFVLSFLVATQIAYAAETQGPHGGSIVEDQSNKFEVKIDPKAKQVEVFTLNAKKGPPKKMAITLFRESGTGQTIELQAVNLADPLPKYEGELKPFGGSYVGAELRFEVSLKSFQILKFIPQLPQPSGSGH
jgi:hypothetical protein